MLAKLTALAERDFGGLLQCVLEAASVGLDVERVSYWRLDEGPSRTIFCELGYTRSLRAFERGIVLREHEHPRYFEAIASEDLVLRADDARNDPRTSGFAAYLREYGITSMMNVGVWAHGKLAGVLCLEHTGAPRTWDEDEALLAIAIGQVIGRALEARERERAEEEVRRALFLSDATAKLSETFDIEAVPDAIVDLFVPALGDWGALFTVEEGARVRCVAARHRDAARVGLLRQIVEERGSATGCAGPQLAELVSSGRALLLPAADQLTMLAFGVDDPALLRAVEQLGCRSAMIVPLSARGRGLGFLVLAAEERTFGRDSLDYAAELGNRAAVNLDNARLYREAKEAIRARDEFLAVASHELKTPLTSLGLAAEALSPVRGAPAGFERAVQLVRRQHRRLSALVRELLDVSRIQSGDLHLQLEPMDLSRLVGEAVQSFEEQARRGGGPLELKAQGPVTGCWDHMRLDEVIENLLSNAIKFGRGRPIEVSVSADPDVAQVTVRDHGIGIPQERLGGIFNKFERAVSTRQYAGLGLGLYLSRAIARAHGGDIRIESKLGRGTTVTVTLPRHLRRGVLNNGSQKRNAPAG